MRLLDLSPDERRDLRHGCLGFVLFLVFAFAFLFAVYGDPRVTAPPPAAVERAP